MFLPWGLCPYKKAKHFSKLCLLMQENLLGRQAIACTAVTFPGCRRIGSCNFICISLYCTTPEDNLQAGRSGGQLLTRPAYATAPEWALGALGGVGE